MNTKFSTVLRLALIASFSYLAMPTAFAQINYQGRLTDDTGAALPDGPTTLIFSIWDLAENGTQLWGPFTLDGGTDLGHGPQADIVDNGRFNVIIGNLDESSRSLTTSMGTSDTLYLEIQVAGNDPITPRQIILPAPRALRADVLPNVTPTSTGVDISGNTMISGGLGLGTTPGSSGVIALTPEFGFGFEQTTGSVRLATQIALGAGWFGTITNHPLNFYVNNASPSLSIATNGNIGIGIGTNTPSVKLDVDGSVNVSGDLNVNKVNGEKPPYTFELGDKNNTDFWHQVHIPGSIIEDYLGDANGGTVRFLLRVNNTDEVRVIDEQFYIEQPDKSRSATAGLHGWSRQGGGGDKSFILDNGIFYDLIPGPWEWVFMSNGSRAGRPGLPAGTDGPARTGDDKFTVTFLTRPNVSATVIIYDR